jgi:hypothetical protein
MSLCQYKYSLGIPGQGFHKQRIFGFALFDIIGTAVLAWILSKYTSYRFIPILIVLFLIGTMLHVLFCVDTTFVKIITGK